MAGDYYTILGVSRTATREEVQAAYRKMSELYNPETGKENPFVANICHKMEEARGTLIDTAKREAYDVLLRERESGGSPVAPRPPEKSARHAEPSMPAAGVGGKPAGGPASASDQELRAFFSESLRAEKAEKNTLGDYLHSRIAIVVVGSVLLIDALAWIFGLRLSGGTFGFLFRSSNLAIIGWAIYAALRHYTANAIFALLFSLLYSIVYAVFIVRIHLNPMLYPGVDVARVIFEKTAVYFFIFYLTFFCSTQIVEEGGFGSIRERTFAKR
jgi:hypothetical protein